MAFRAGRYRLAALAVGAVILVSASYAFAQFRNRGFDVLGAGSGYAPKVFPDRDFAICRLVYTEGRRWAGGWRTDGSKSPSANRPLAMSVRTWSINCR